MSSHAGITVCGIELGMNFARRGSRNWVATASRTAVSNSLIHVIAVLTSGDSKSVL